MHLAKLPPPLNNPPPPVPAGWVRAQRTFEASAPTAIINAGTPAPAGVAAGMHCASVATLYILRFTPRAAGGSSVVVTLGGCPHAYGITVNGKQQPSLWDDDKLRMAAAGLAGVVDHAGPLPVQLAQLRHPHPARADGLVVVLAGAAATSVMTSRPDGGGLVTFLVYLPDDLVLVVKIPPAFTGASVGSEPGR